MNNLKFVLLILVSINLYAENSVENKLDKLNIPSHRVSPLISKDKLYVVNKRYSSLVKRHEINLSGANDFAAEGHLITRQVTASYQFHLDSKWSFGLSRTNYYNELSKAGKTLFENKQILSDSDYAYSSTQVFTSFNTIYGKVRFAKDSVVYFDQFVSLGIGKVDLKSGSQNLATLDLGLAFWIGKNYSFKTGLKNEFYTQRQLSGETDVHNGMGYVSFGYLFGGNSIWGFI